MENVFSMSGCGQSEYCCNVTRIGKILPIPGKDLIGQTIINGESIVVRKDLVREGDVLVYAENETQLDPGFLRANGLYAEPTMNADTSKKGYFGKNGRVRMIKLGGVQSMGYLFSKAELVAWCPQAADVNLEEWIDQDFDTVCGQLLIRAYVPPMREKPARDGAGGRRQKRVKMFDRFVSEGEFEFHYNTQLLAKNLEKLQPDTGIDITVKAHGTSVIVSRIPVRTPVKLSRFKQLSNWLIKTTGLFKEKLCPEYKEGYGVVYSSRTVIKNRFINPNSDPGGYYGQDIWSDYGELIGDFVYPGMTVYGEIVGYLTGVSKGIQKDYDYGCLPGRNKIMPYRITTDEFTPDGVRIKREWEIAEVMDWTRLVMLSAPGLRERIMPLTLLFSGPVKDLYPDIDYSAEDWRDTLLARMKADARCLGMEKVEPLCLEHNVPREGVCIRIQQDQAAECFKLKCLTFLGREAKEIDEGKVDMELQEQQE